MQSLQMQAQVATAGRLQTKVIPFFFMFKLTKQQDIKSKPKITEEKKKS
jgi:hypothetical protein